MVIIASNGIEKSKLSLEFRISVHSCLCFNSCQKLFYSDERFQVLESWSFDLISGFALKNCHKESH